MLGAAKDRGRWWTDHDKLCVKWFRWFEAKPRCITLRREGNRIFWNDQEGESGTATLEEAKQVPLPIECRVTEPENLRATVTASPVAPSPPAAMEPSNSSPMFQFSGLPLTEIVAMRVPEAEMSRLGADVPGRKAVDAPEEKVSHPSTPPAAKPSPRVSAVQIQPAFRVAGVEAGDSLNVRGGPSEYHPAVGSLPADGRGIQIIGACLDSWCPIQRGGVVGWVNRYYLSEEGATSDPENDSITR
jgi:hypothetical protein